MAEQSMFWTNNLGHGGPYTQDDWHDFLWSLMGGADGVLPGVRNLLAVTSPAANQVRVDTGGAIVDGAWYDNDAAITLSLTTPSVGTTGFFVGLRKDWATRTVTAIVKMNTDGTSAAPTPTKTDGSVWEMVLAPGTITTAGAVTITGDNREYVLRSANDARYVNADGDNMSGWLTVSGAFSVPNMEHAKAYKTANASHSADVWTKVTFPNASPNVGTRWSTTNSNFTVPSNGYYYVAVVIKATQTGVASTTMNVRAFVDAAENHDFGIERMPQNVEVAVNGSAILYLTGGQVLDIRTIVAGVGYTVNGANSANCSSVIVRRIG